MSAGGAAAATAFDAYEWINLFMLGGVAGALGQGARSVVGFKKINDAASAASVPASELLAASRIFVSLAIGFIAGALSAIWLLDGLQDIEAEKIFTLVAAGYAGTDIIEGLITRVQPSASSPAGAEAVGVGGAGVGGSAGSGGGTANDDAVG